MTHSNAFFALLHSQGARAAMVCIVLLSGTWACSSTRGLDSVTEDLPEVVFTPLNNGLLITIGGQEFASYFHHYHETTTRPFFANVFSPCGVAATRSFPDGSGLSSSMNAMHPGMWLAFGNVNGKDYWRNRHTVRYDSMLGDPQGGWGRGAFSVRNAYMDGTEVLFTEVAHYTILVRPHGYLLLWNSTFTAESQDLVFGDQEEMGLGIQVHSDLSVRNGNGQIVNADRLLNEEGTWAMASDWIAFRGVDGETESGIALMPDPANFERSRYHSRDYGLMVSNPFARSSFLRGDIRNTVVPKGQSLALNHGIYVFCGTDEERVSISDAYADYLNMQSQYQQ